MFFFWTFSEMSLKLIWQLHWQNNLCDAVEITISHLLEICSFHLHLQTLTVSAHIILTILSKELADCVGIFLITSCLLQRGCCFLIYSAISVFNEEDNPVGSDLFHQPFHHLLLLETLKTICSGDVRCEIQYTSCIYQYTLTVLLVIFLFVDSILTDVSELMW